MNGERTELVVLGGGPGGYAAAFRAADLGKSVTLIDPEPILGGACLLRGCIPSKGLITAAELAEQIRDAGSIGIETGPVTVHMDRVSQWKQQVIRQIGKGLGELAKRRNVRWVRGRAGFVDSHHITVQPDGGSDFILGFESAVVATGSEPSFPPGLEPDGQFVLSSTEALELTRIPRRLLVIGGGYIGLELGSCFRLFGGEVTLVELTDGLLPGTDPELVRPVVRKLESRSVRILLRSRVVSLDRSGGILRATIDTGTGEPLQRDFDQALVCVGRKPCTSRLALDRAGILTDERGFIRCDAQGRTSQPTVFAIGDCSGGVMLAHKARRDGIVAAEAICGQASTRDQTAVPAVIFSDPEIAYCGQGELEARAAGREIKVTRFPFAALGRAVLHRAPEGMVKLICDRDDERVLGAGIVGVCASELIAEATLAVELGATAEDLMHTIHAHPTLSEAMPEAAELMRGPSIHIYKKDREGRR